MTSLQPDTQSARTLTARPSCATYGTDDVVRDAWAAWDAEHQVWTLDAVFDHAFCIQCQATTTLAWSPEVDETMPV